MLKEHDTTKIAAAVEINEAALITFEDFLKVNLRVGTIIKIDDNQKALKPAYVLTIDFGHYGIKTSSAQITDHYSKEDLLGRQIVAVMNFPAKRVAGIKSEVLVLGAMTEGVVLLQPTMKVPNGSAIG